MTRLARLLRVRPGEQRTVGLMVGGLLLAWSGSSIGANGVESLLLATVGPRVLPLLYIGLAAASLGVSLLVARWLRGAGSPRLLLRGVALCAVGAGGIRVLVELPPRWAYPAAWLSMMVVWTLTNLLLWAILGSLHDTRQAKRLFPLYGAAVVLGVSGGGFLIPPLAASIGVENLVVVWVIALLLSCLLIGRVLPAASRVTRRRRRSADGDGAMRTVRRSPLLRWMAVSLASAAFLYFALTLLFARGVAQRFPDAAELAGFLGVFGGAASVTALAFSLLIANRLFAAVGLATAIFVLPVLYLGGFAAVAASGSFVVLAGFRFVQIVWVNGVWAGGWQALFNVVPAVRRDSVRAFLDAVALQPGIAAAGAVALLTQNEAVGVDLAMVGILVAAVAAVAGWRMRAAYTAALVDALRQGDPEVFAAEEHPFGGFRQDRAALAVALDGASNEDPGTRRLSIAVLADAGEEAAIPALRAALRDPDPSIRAISVRGLSQAADPFLAEAVAALITDPDATVRANVVRSLDPAVSEAVLEGAAADPDPVVRAAAARALARGPGPARGLAVVRALLADERPDWRRSGLEAFDAIAEPELPLVLGCLRDPDPGVRLAAADAAVRSGGAAVEPLAELVSGDDGAEAAAALSRLRPRHAAVAAYARRRLEEATRYARAATAIGGSEAGGAIGLLVHSLRHAAFDAAEQGLRAAGSGGEGHAIGLALENLRSADAQQRANAIEALEAAGPPALVRPFVAAWEGGGAARGDARAVEELLGDRDPWIRECARFAATGQDGAMDAPARLSAMDRMVLLRRVPLFADLPPADLKHVADAVVERSFADGEVIAEEGEPGDELHIVVGGEIRVVAGSGSELARRGAGEYVGEMAVISREPRMAALVCAGAVRTLSLDRARFERILRERPDVGIAAMRVLSDRLREAHASGGGSSSS